MLKNIDEIKIEKRIRKDLGNIEDLAKDIKENGLINPPIVTPDLVLIAGERRIQAMKLLGYQQVEVRTLVPTDAEHQLMLEISENEERKDFTKLERLDWARQLERIESQKARERQEKGINQYSERLSQNSDEGSGRVDDVVAEKVGIGSRDTYRKEKYIADNADQETLEAWNNEEISTNKAYKQIKELEKKLKESEEEIRSRDRATDELIKQNKALSEQLEEEKYKEPEIQVVEKEVIKEVIPDDYKDIKKQLENLVRDNQNLKDRLFEEKTNKKEALSLLESEKLNQKIVNDVSGLHYRIAGFIKDVGGLLYLTDYIDELPNKNKKLFLESIKYLREFSEQLYTNVEKYLKEK